MRSSSTVRPPSRHSTAVPEWSQQADIHGMNGTMVLVGCVLAAGAVAYFGMGQGSAASNRDTSGLAGVSTAPTLAVTRPVSAETSTPPVATRTELPTATPTRVVVSLNEFRNAIGTASGPPAPPANSGWSPPVIPWVTPAPPLPASPTPGPTGPTAATATPAVTPAPGDKTPGATPPVDGGWTYPPTPPLPPPPYYPPPEPHGLANPPASEQPHSPHE